MGQFYYVWEQQETQSEQASRGSAREQPGDGIFTPDPTIRCI